MSDFFVSKVSEVLTEDKSRLSVNGWFHGPPVPRQAAYIEKPLPLKRHVHIEQEMVYEWINEIYLDSDVQSQIQEKFENDSEIELQGFLKVKCMNDITFVKIDGMTISYNIMIFLNFCNT